MTVAYLWKQLRSSMEKMLSSTTRQKQTSVFVARLLFFFWGDAARCLAYTLHTGFQLSGPNYKGLSTSISPLAAIISIFPRMSPPLHQFYQQSAVNNVTKCEKNNWKGKACSKKDRHPNPRSKQKPSVPPWQCVDQGRVKPHGSEASVKLYGYHSLTTLHHKWIESI